MNKMQLPGIEIFFPAPEGLPVPIRPPEGAVEVWKIIQETDWKSVCHLSDDGIVRAGALWLHGFLDEAHRLAQEDDSPEGSYWHALVHRSEGDFDNSMYWFRKVKQHEIFPRLRAEVARMDQKKTEPASADALQALVAESSWNPRRFVDLCREAREGRFAGRALLERVAAAEYNLLMAHLLRTRALSQNP